MRRDDAERFSESHSIKKKKKKKKIANTEVRLRITRGFRPQMDLLAIAKKRKLKYYGHVRRSLDLVKEIL